jgi:ABC-type transporter Mla subunit MlaD
MKTVIKFLIVSVLAVAFLAGCAKQPTEEINASKAAVQAVVTDEGEKYAAEETKKLNDDLNAALAEVKAQDQKFLKNYDKAKGMLSQIKTDAETVKATIPARKEEAKNKAVASMEAAKAAIDEAKGLLGKAPRGKGSSADIEAMKADLKGLEESLPEAQGMFDKGDFFGANEKAAAVKDKAAAISAQVNEAIEKVKAAKGGKK